MRPLWAGLPSNVAPFVVMEEELLYVLMLQNASMDRLEGVAS